MKTFALTFDLISVFFFAMSGTITAVKHNRLDLFGVIFVALITAVGGGTVRDMLLDAHPITWISNSSYVVSMLFGSIGGLLLMRIIDRFKKPFVFIDALGVSFAALAGLQKSLDFGSSGMAAILFAVITATVGGIIRDVICNEVPMVLRSEIYATAVVVGAVFYLFSIWVFGIPEDISYILSFLIIVGVRMFSVRYGWNLDLEIFESMRNNQKKKIRRRKSNQRA